MGDNHHYALHGLIVQSPFPLDGVVLAKPSAKVGIEIVIVDELAWPSSSRRTILAYDDNEASVCSVESEDRSVIVSFPGHARFRISPSRDRIEVWAPDPDAFEMARILLQGWVMTMTLMLRGYVVIHATAVDFDRGCVAFLADSGMGKSTIAAMLIRDGGKLVSDDVLRIEPAVEGVKGWSAYPGITALRLRSAASGLAEFLPDASLGKTADNRTSVRLERSQADPSPIRAILIPTPSRTATELRVSWLDPVQAAIELDQRPRVYDWEITDPIKRHFEAMADLSADVPVGLLTVPWGPPWMPNMYGPLSDLLPEPT